MSSDEFTTNRRSQRRYTLSTTINIIDRSTGKSLGRLVNVTSDGMMLVNTSPLVTDTLYQISLELPSPIKGQTTIDLGMDCLWTSPATADADTYWSGCHIIDISPDMATCLDALIETLTG